MFSKKIPSLLSPICPVPLSAHTHTDAHTHTHAHTQALFLVSCALLRRLCKYKYRLFLQKNCQTTVYLALSLNNESGEKVLVLCHGHVVFHSGEVLDLCNQSSVERHLKVLETKHKTKSPANQKTSPQK